MLLRSIIIASFISDLWGNTVFQALLTGLVSVVVGVLTNVIFSFYYKGTKRKEVSYSVVSDMPLPSFEKEVEGVSFDENRVKGVSLVILKVWNSGSTPIKPEDYFEAVTFIFNGRNVIDSSLRSIEAVKPANFTIRFKSNTIELLNHCRNPKQSITVNILLKGTKETMSVNGRIDNGKIIERN